MRSIWPMRERSLSSARTRANALSASLTCPSCASSKEMKPWSFNKYTLFRHLITGLLMQDT